MVDHVFSLTGTDLAASKIIGGMFNSFEKTCPLGKVKLPGWDLPMVLREPHLPVLWASEVVLGFFFFFFFTNGNTE